MKRNASVILAIVLILMMVAGCTAAPTTTMGGTTAPTTAKATTTAKPTATDPANFNKTGYPIVKEPITLSITGRMSALATTWEGNLQLDFLTRKTGIKFKATGISQDSWTEKKSLMFASDDLPDLFVSSDFTSAQLLEYGSDKQLIALNGLIDQYGTAIKAALSEFPIAKAMATSSDGNMYSLPRINRVIRDMHTRYWLNKKWIENLKMKVPTTLNELYDVLKAFKDKDPNGNGKADEIPLSGIKGAATYDGLILNALGVNTRSAEYGITATDAGKVFCVNTTDEYKAYLKYMNKLYAEKILDNDIFVQTTEQLTAKAQQNIIGGVVVAAMYITANTTIGYDYMQIDALTSDMNQKKMVSASTGISVGKTAITSKNKYPEATLRLLDFFYTEDGGKVAYVGEEGVGWNWIDKAKGTWDKAFAEGYKTQEDFRNAKSTIIDGWGGWERSEFNAGQGSTNAFWLNEMSNRDSYPYFVTEFPKSYLPLTVADSEKVAKIETDVTAYVKESRARFISGENNIDSMWSTYVTNIKNMGIDQVVTIYQKYYDAFRASMK